MATFAFLFFPSAVHSSLVQRPGGTPVTFSAKELQRAEAERHAACGVQVMDANEPGFGLKFFSDLGTPKLVKNLIHAWPALQKWTPAWFEEQFVQEEHGPAWFIRPWNLSDAQNPHCGNECSWIFPRDPDHAGISGYFRHWNARDAEGIFMEPNGVIFSPQHPDLSEAPMPELFIPMLRDDYFTVRQRHVAFAALGTSHGFHRHNEAWQAQVVGYKSWYLLPDHLYTHPVDETTTGPPFGFPHEEPLQLANTLCGYTPEEDKVHAHLSFCVQGPGEVMYVPRNWWHGTCALDEYTAATGGGLWLEELRFENGGIREQLMRGSYGSLLMFRNNGTDPVDVFLVNKSSEDKFFRRLEPSEPFHISSDHFIVFRDVYGRDIPWSHNQTNAKGETTLDAAAAKLKSTWIVATCTVAIVLGLTTSRMCFSCNTLPSSKSAYRNVRTKI
eukprot:gnl/TRDRNA2_/TRDRNA2_201570_c0_seq1.p1 gnl/TRDRNA2_/TRDRNA2_201570_c0~~gnl/TRDRNA2_/TRDRNA2_201570_c0_seq1.p1  ORF type:complete len:482 (+),score=30.33 gnl/TRDRNA2_/TRDRNA2_201570_c0_seq1:120-1448(+)